jgi:hypothetical protein
MLENAIVVDTEFPVPCPLEADILAVYHTRAGHVALGSVNVAKIELGRPS